MPAGGFPGGVLDQRQGLALADQAGRFVQAVAQAGGAVLQVMGVAGQDGDHALLQQLVRQCLGLGAEAASDRGRGDLQQAALLEQRFELGGLAHQALVALGVGDHRDHAFGQQPGGELFHAEGDFAVWQLQEEYGFALPLADEGDGLALDAGHEFDAEAHLGGGGHLEGDVFVGQGLAEHGERGVDGRRGVVVAPRVDVRGADQVGDAFGHGPACEGQRGGQVGRAVVDAGEQMIVEVDHRGSVGRGGALWLGGRG